MDIDNEILQEFLVEAGELYEKLSDQLVSLEQQPDDTDLLNAIFRAFHTIKGGAGFMKLTPMVDACHRAEDVINLLRQGERQVDAELIDTILQMLDVLGEMFDSIRAGEEPPAAPPELLQRLQQMVRSGGSAPAAKPHDVAPAARQAQAAVTADMDSEFEAMLDGAQMDCSAGDVKADAGDADDLITDDEFENLLDELHGKGKHSAAAMHAHATEDAASADADLITDEEFEAVLDQLHGKNRGPGDTGTMPQTGTATATAEAEPGSDDAPAPGLDAPATPKRKAHAAPVETSLRVDTARLDDIMNLVGELVLVRNRLSTLKHAMKQRDVIDAISNLELVTSDLQSSVMKTRMQPIRKVFSRFPRVIRDLARQLDKDIELELIGEETEIDKSMVEALADPLIHLVRNAADHGIESPEQRFNSGKSRQGHVILSARQEGDQILLTVSDDGRGMDHEALRRKAVEKGMMNEDAARNLSNTEAYNLTLAAGFSTKTEISDVSGRGVGMDVVKTRIAELNGNIEIDSSLGRGSVITIRLPLTLAILPTLMIRLNGHQFALPLSNVNEAFNLEPGKINVVDGQQVMRVRNRPLPLFYLRQWLVNDAAFEGAKQGHKVVVAQMGGQSFCLVVDHIIGQEEVVIKPLGAMLYQTPGFSGATITGDGSIALIIDVPSLVGAYASGCQGYV